MGGLNFIVLGALLLSFHTFVAVSDYIIFDDKFENGLAPTTLNGGGAHYQNTSAYAGQYCIALGPVAGFGAILINIPGAVLHNYTYINFVGMTTPTAGSSVTFNVDFGDTNGVYVSPAFTPVWKFYSYPLSQFINTAANSAWTGWNVTQNYTIDFRLVGDHVNAYMFDNFFLSTTIPSSTATTGGTITTGSASTTGAATPSPTPAPTLAATLAPTPAPTPAPVVCPAASTLPFLDEKHTSVSSDVLTVTVDLNLYQAWLSTSVNVGNSTTPACQFTPAINQSGCAASFVLQMPWGSHAQCNFVEDATDPNYFIYRAPIFITTVESAGQLHGISLNYTHIDILNIAVRLPKSITVSASVQLVAPIDLESQIIFRDYNPSTSIGTITFDAALQWPFALDGGFVASLPAGISLVDFQDVTQAGACSNTDSSFCLQTFTFHVTPTSSCQLTGNYVVDFNIVCRGSGECPLPVPATANLTFSLVSTDFCASVGRDVNVSAAIASYSDAALQKALASFEVGGTGYFKISVSSPQIPLAHTQLDTVVISQGANSFLPSGVTSVNNGVSTVSFALYFNSSLFSVPVDGSLSYMITVKVDLTFSGSRKRDSTDSLQYSSSAQIPIQITAPSISSYPSAPVKDTPAPHSNKSMIIGTVVGVVVGGLAVGGILFATLKLYKRKQIEAPRV